MLITPIPVVKVLQHAEAHPDLYTVTPHPDEGPQTGWYFYANDSYGEWAAIIVRQDDEWVAWVKDIEGSAYYTMEEFLNVWLEGAL